MAIKSLLNKFKKKFNWEGKNFKELIVNIFASGRKTIETRIIQDTFSDWKKQEKRIGKINFPTVEDFLSSNAKLIQVATIGSQEVTDTLKKVILNDLYKAIEEGQPTGIFKRGEFLNDSVINSFKNKLNTTFTTYVEKDAVKAGKLEQIALTESRNIVNPLKYKYAMAIKNSNPDLYVTKEWQHYPWKSKEPRDGHREKNKEQLLINEKYKVNYYIKSKGQVIQKGHDYMLYPHDTIGGARQNVNCHCDIRFIVRRKKRL